ncbi:MAG: FecR domain-containing protein [Lacunisphaera sp.]
MKASAPIIPEEIQDAAATWLARRDRGLGATEQDDYLEWLYASPVHGRAIVQLERIWVSLNLLAEWRPAHSTVPNPDLLAPRRPSPVYRLSAALGAVAAVALAFYAWLPHRADAPPPRREAIIHPGAERMPLDDGSVVELDAGAKIAVHFTPGERRVQLVRGKAHFAVAKNPDRPFIVSAGKFAVRAVGTAFSVALESQEVSVLVTEGKVRLDETAAAAGDAAPPTPVELSHLVAGQQATVTLAGPGVAVPQVRDVTPAEMERALAWQGLRLEFVDMPLADVAATFNRYNRLKLVLADDETGAILVGGSFRADNVDAFVRLLDSSFGVSAFPHNDELVLRKTH